MIHFIEVPRSTTTRVLEDLYHSWFHSERPALVTSVTYFQNTNDLTHGLFICYVEAFKGLEECIPLKAARPSINDAGVGEGLLPDGQVKIGGHTYLSADLVDAPEDEEGPTGTPA